ncbi:hypothetical protein L596_030630 [Steinernema carpocapsae]|uniref:Uncharacterized protein n=1 Tax=Steinernema carpocapsae TaxID=34508 RepID=A0A4U5LPX9_STECR|nr:hypothetical protein L596_030630 [Steinernema carpocapsae]
MTRPASSGTPLVKWPLSLPLPCDVELVTLRSISSKSVLALFRRLPFDPHTSSPIPSDCSGSLESFWNLLVASYKGASFHISNLTGTQKGALLDKILFEALLEEAFVIKSVRIELP